LLKSGFKGREYRLRAFPPPFCFVTHFEKVGPLIPFYYANAQAPLPLPFHCSSLATFSSLLYLVIITSGKLKIYRKFTPHCAST
jgi:hypothetical protein